MTRSEHVRRPRSAAIIAALVGSLTLVACVHQAPDDEVKAAKRRADAAAQELTATLMAKLTSEIAARGPVAAVGVCQDVAQDLTRALGAREGLILRRTAMKTRNPVNAPADWERAWLEQAEAAVRAGRAPQPLYEVTRPRGSPAELRHLRPILFPGGVCSRCHGLAEEIPDDVRAVLRERYPQDAATGFRAGDLRGAISVRVPLTGNGAQKSRTEDTRPPVRSRASTTVTVRP